MICAKFGLNCPSGSGEDFLILSMSFRYIRYYLPLEKGRALHLNKIESPSPKDALCQVWLKLVLEEKIFKVRQCTVFLLFPWIHLNRAWPFI